MPKCGVNKRGKLIISSVMFLTTRPPPPPPPFHPKPKPIRAPILVITIKIRHMVLWTSFNILKGSRLLLGVNMTSRNMKAKTCAKTITPILIYINMEIKSRVLSFPLYLPRTTITRGLNEYALTVQSVVDHPDPICNLEIGSNRTSCPVGASQLLRGMLSVTTKVTEA